MSDNQKSLAVSDVTVDRILSQYLWNSPIPPKREDMGISITSANRTPVKIDATDYMKNGAGRYATAADFKMFENFFKTSNLPARNTPYSFDEIGNKIYGVERFNSWKNGFYSTTPGKGFTVAVSQYGIDTSSSDYVERAFIFGSTQVVVTPDDLRKLQFFVRPDGSREIRNLRITPKNDNFDFIGGSSSQDVSDRMQKWMVDTANSVFNSVLDPKRIGRSVPLVYTDTDKLPFVNITDKDFKKLQSEKSNRKISDTLIEETGIPLLLQSRGLIDKLKKSPALYDKSLLGRLRDIEQNANEMYPKTRDLIKKDPNMMSWNERDEPYRHTQLSFSSDVQRLHEKARILLTELNQRENIHQSPTEFANTAAFITVAMQKAKMTDADVIGRMDGKLHIIHDTLKLDVAIVDPHKAAQTPVADSVAQSKQTEQQFEYETRQRQLAQSQSRGISIA
ncbi:MULTISPECIES: calcium-binding protein [Neisseriaceae]|uniref:Calcium-binding protein n=2 Tax=Morococcus cerebrosus TaxID=1056807 RepID=A0ABY3YEC0_9NEIS|nr:MULTISPECIES: calcium-binding protein [Neisseriaceae]UNV87294.1 calcium-binding protein [Morococcus cerebrosus]